MLHSTADQLERYFSPEATALLTQFRQTTDAAQQHKLINQVEANLLQDLPISRSSTRPTGSTYSTLHFTGWPTNANRYTSSSVNDTWLGSRCWTTLKPVT